MKENKQLKLKNDIFFKYFFTQYPNYLESFLCSIFKEKIKILQIIPEARLIRKQTEDKYGTLDLDIELANGELVNIEMQLKDNKNIEQRTTYYASKKIASQLKKKNKYTDLKRVIVITILNYKITDLPEYVTETIRVAKEHREYEINNVVKYIYIELEKFREIKRSMKEPINQWLSILDMEREEWIKEAMKENIEVKEAYVAYKELTGTAEAKRLAEIAFLDSLEGEDAKAVARHEGIEEGFKKGEAKSKKEIAKKLLKKKLSIKEIVEITGLSVEEIEKMKY